METMIFGPSQRERVQFCVLFCIQAHAQALWYVPFSNVLRAHGLEALVPYAFASTSLAAFISPMLGGALADRHISAERLLRWLAIGTAGFLCLTFLAIEKGCAAWLVLGALIIQQLFSAPTWSLACTIVLGRLREPEREFGSVRVWATFGWLVAGPLLSFALAADNSTLTGFAAAAVWLVVAGFTFLLPKVPPRASPIHGWRALTGWDALPLLHQGSHRAVFISAALFSIPLAAFYPFTVTHLHALGESRVAAAMSLGQVTEVLAMYALAPLLASLRFKTILLAAISAGVARYAFFALNSLPWVLAGIALHGICFTLFFISVQVYLEVRVEPQLRSRAQALMTVMTGGVGNLVGALGCGWWLSLCTVPQRGTNWSLYWGVLCAVTLAVLGFFALGYRNHSRLGPRLDSPQDEKREASLV